MNDYSLSCTSGIDLLLWRLLSNNWQQVSSLSFHSSLDTQEVCLQTVATKTPRTPRAMTKQARRIQLIKATIACIASKGLSGTTMADVTQQAGLSLGIVNLHFKSKDKLLIETLQYVADEYQQGLEKIYSDSSLDIAEKIKAQANYDFSKKIIDRNKLAVWFAFWGEAKARPTYSDICARYDAKVANNLTALFTDLKSQGNYPDIDPQMTSIAYTALTDGLWLDLLISPRQLSAAKACAVVGNFLARQFPQHF
jgi:TetR/AcrR family transcriptional repressor of bet genes